MNKRKLTIVLMLCLACVLLMTGCHSSNDPWPASSGTGSGTATDTAISTDTAQATEVPAPTDVPADNIPDSDPSVPGING